MKTLAVVVVLALAASCNAAAATTGDSARSSASASLSSEATALGGHADGQPSGYSKSPSDLIRAAGYPAEAHRVTTEDGYVLRLDRIPRPGAKPVLLAHTLLGSSFIFLILGKHKSIGFLLYEAGFDVWLANYRGSSLSREHTHLSSDEDEYWKFGWQENGALDNPALIDYIVATTGKPRLLYLGHSLGSTTFFAMASERPDALAKVEAAFICAPPVFLSHSTDPTTRLGHFLGNVSQALIEWRGLHQLPEEKMRRGVRSLCASNSTLLDRLCLKVTGMDDDAASLLPDLVAFFPSGGSAWQILHYTQLNNPKWPGFRKFNYGSAKANWAKYGSDSPPDFSLQHIDTPVYLYNGHGDVMCTMEDLKKLRSSLPNVRRFFFSPNAKLGHRDFVLRASAVRDVWQYVLADMAPYGA